MIRCHNIVYMTAFVVAFGCLVSLPDHGEAVNCFVCSTDTDKRCDDPMNMTRHSIEDCSRSPHSTYLQPVCKKQKQRVNGELVIIRSCAWASDSRSDDGPCAINTPRHIQIEHCSTCDLDLCNGVAAVGGTVFLTGVLAFATKFATDNMF